jgi:hemerythrin-like domain-containing protein
MTPTEELRHEHDIILLVLSGAEKEALSGGSPDRVVFREMVDFFINFVDRCHHGKEEKHLFPLLEVRGIPREGGPIGVMLAEHTEGRQLVRNLDDGLSRLETGNGRDASTLKTNLLGYVKLLRSHIEKENAILFAMADNVLTAGDREKLSKAFAKVESEEMGEGVHEKYHEMAHRLAAP